MQPSFYNRKGKFFFFLIPCLRLLIPLAFKSNRYYFLIASVTIVYYRTFLYHVFKLNSSIIIYRWKCYLAVGAYRPKSHSIVIVFWTHSKLIICSDILFFKLPSFGKEVRYKRLGCFYLCWNLRPLTIYWALNFWM